VEAGYKDFILVVGFKPELMKFFVENYLAEKRNEGLKIKLINQFEILGPKEEIYGTACPVMCVKDIVGKNNFLYICGDNFYSVRDLESVKTEDSFNYVFGRKVAHPENFGVLKISGELLEKIIEKPKEFVGDIINASLYKFTLEIFEKVNVIKKSSRGEYEITDAINLLAIEGKVKANKLQDQDYWIDFGRPDDIERFEKILKHGNN
jgi:dTDP-glucose pyrophosphorylase